MPRPTCYRCPARVFYVHLLTKGTAMTITAVEAADSTTTYSSRPREGRALRSASALLVGLVAWLVWNFLASPTQFANVSRSRACSIGAIYALIALGYTLVYGIIELINFAHGDLFMLGIRVLLDHPGAVARRRPRARLRTGRMLLVDAGGGDGAAARVINVGIEFIAYRRLRRAPKLAPLITAVGMCFILQCVGLLLNGSAPKSWPEVIPARRAEASATCRSTAVDHRRRRRSRSRCC